MTMIAMHVKNIMQIEFRQGVFGREQGDFSSALSEDGSVIMELRKKKEAKVTPVKPPFRRC